MFLFLTDIDIYAIGTGSASSRDLELFVTEPARLGVHYYLAETYSEIEIYLTRLRTEVCGGSSNVHCTLTGEAGIICFCRYGQCDNRALNSTRCDGTTLLY